MEEILATCEKDVLKNNILYIKSGKSTWVLKTSFLCNVFI